MGFHAPRFTRNNIGQKHKNCRLVSPCHAWFVDWSTPTNHLSIFLSYHWLGSVVDHEVKLASEVLPRSAGHCDYMDPVNSLVLGRLKMWMGLISILMYVLSLLRGDEFMLLSTVLVDFLITQ